MFLVLYLRLLTAAEFNLVIRPLLRCHVREVLLLSALRDRL